MAGLNVVTFTFLAVTFLKGGFGVTDEEFQSIDPIVARLFEQMSKEIGKLKGQNEKMEEKILTQDLEFKRLSAVVNRYESALKSKNREWELEVLETEMAQNNTIEERVSLLEIQVADLREDVTEVDEDVTGLDEDINFLFDEQVIQDERLFSLEQTSLQVAVELAELNANILDLDTRVVVLEENGGGNGNSSVAELEERVETLEGTAADHETRITDMESNVEDLETRVTTGEENIQGLQATVVTHDIRISALEEDGGGSDGSGNDTIAFHSVLTSYGSISVGDPVIFSEVILNEGNGYDSTAGRFTVPSGGEGTYYFSTYMTAAPSESAIFDIRLNNVVICSLYPDHAESGDFDAAPGSCSAVVDVVAGDEVQIILDFSNDNTPLYLRTGNYLQGFNGFRI